MRFGRLGDGLWTQSLARFFGHVTTLDRGKHGVTREEDAELAAYIAPVGKPRAWSPVQAEAKAGSEEKFVVPLLPEMGASAIAAGRFAIHEMDNDGLLNGTAKKGNL